jgi:hypothetical protein
MCPHTAAHVSSYCYIYVLMLLSSYCYICVLILLHMRPHVFFFGAGTRVTWPFYTAMRSFSTTRSATLSRHTLRMLYCHISRACAAYACLIWHTLSRHTLRMLYQCGILCACSTHVAYAAHALHMGQYATHALHIWHTLCMLCTYGIRCACPTTKCALRSFPTTRRRTSSMHRV